MPRLTFSGEDKSPDEIWIWFSNQKTALFRYKNEILHALINGKVIDNNKFIDKTRNEINDDFESQQKELEYLTCFDLISSIEAILRKDFYRRVYKKDKTDLGRIFRNYFKQKEHRISLEKDIIETWKNYAGDKIYFSHYLGLLKFRNWLAHGRFWTPKFTPVNPEDVFTVSIELRNVIKNYN